MTENVSLQEHDFIRQTILEGLAKFRFRFTHLEWVGWGYTLQSIRDVINAYLVLEGMRPDVNTHPNAELMLRKTGTFLIKVCVTAALVKETFDGANFILEAYRKIMVVAPPAISGLLTHS